MLKIKLIKVSEIVNNYDMHIIRVYRLNITICVSNKLVVAE